MKRGVLVAAVFLTLVGGPAAAAQPARERVVMISVPAINWEDLHDARLPNIGRLLRSVGAMSARTAARGPNVERGYLTLGAGSPGFVPHDDPRVHLAFRSGDAYEGGAAAEAARRRTGLRPEGEVVHVGVAFLQKFQEDRLYGSRVGNLGDALRAGGVERAVVSAADLAVDPTDEERRRGAVLALMDSAGAVDHGTLDGLLRPSPRAPFGVETDPAAFALAARRALERAQVVLLDAGETSRADEYVRWIAPDRVGEARRAALERTDHIVGRILPLLRTSHTVLLFAPSGPTSPTLEEHLAPIAASGRGPDGTDFGEAWLTSATTSRQGMVVLSDVAPTILRAFDLDEPASMVGTPIRAGVSRSDGIEELVELDIASSVRERFAASVFWVLGILFSLLALLAFVVFLGTRGPFLRLLVAVAYFGLAIFPAAHIVRAFEYWWAGALGAHFLLYAVAAALAAAAWHVPGPRWAGGVALMILAVLLYGSDFAVGGPLQVNGVFGHSPLVAGRFYGVSNPGYAILFSAAFLGVTGLVEMRRRKRLPLWGVVVFVALLPVIGLPSMGADFGGLLAGVPAVGVGIALGRGWPIRWRTVAGLAVAAGAVALGLSFLDLLRAPEARTHLGRFAQLLVSGSGAELATIVQRKGAASLRSLTVTRWTYFIPVGVAVLVLLLARPRGVVGDVLGGHRVLRAGLWGTLVAGVVGFAVNDSGISIPALALAHVVPFLVLFAVETVASRAPPGPG